MARFEYERTINASPQACFDLFSDLESVQQISSEVVAIKRTNDKGFEPGMTFTCTREMMGKQHTEDITVESVDPGRSYTMGCESCGAMWRTTYKFDPVGDATIVTIDMVSKPISLLAKLMTPLMFLFRGMVNKSMNKELDELKAACEAR